MTTAALFTPANGLESRRIIVARELGATEYGGLVPYVRLETLLGVNRRTVQSVVGSARSLLEREYQRCAVAVANKGYRIAQPSEHMELGVAHQKRSRRQLQRALSVLNGANLSKLTEGESAAIAVGVASIGMQLDYQRRNDMRAAQHEQMIKATSSDNARTQSEVDELRARLETLERDKNRVTP